MTTNNDDMVNNETNNKYNKLNNSKNISNTVSNNKTNNKHTFVNDNTDTSDIISNNKADIVENNNDISNFQENNANNIQEYNTGKVHKDDAIEIQKENSISNIQEYNTNKVQKDDTNNTQEYNNTINIPEDNTSNIQEENNTNNTQEDSEEINEEEAVKQILKDDRSAYDSFLDYDRRAKEGEFLLNQYFNNPKLTTLYKYLWFNCTVTCIYLYRYKTISNLLNEDKSNKTILIIKHIIYITYALTKMLLVSFTLFTMRLTISTIKLIFYIFELLSSFFTCMLFPKDIELILKKFRKKLESNSDNRKNGAKVNRYWVNLKDYWKYIFAKITGKVNTNKRIIRPTLNLALLKRKKISFLKKILIRVKHWTKLKMFNLRLINIIDNNKNKIRKRNAKNQMKYIRKVLDDYRKNRNTKKSETKLQIKRKNKNSLKNIIKQIRKSGKSKDIKNKLIQKISELTTKTKKLEFLGEKILFNTLFVKITKSFVQEKDLQTNLTTFQKAQYDRYNKAEEEKRDIKENEIKNKKENIKENSREQENNQKDKTDRQDEINDETKNKIENNLKNRKTVKESVDIINLKGTKNKNENIKPQKEFKEKNNIKDRTETSKINCKTKEEFTNLEQQITKDIKTLEYDEDKDLLDQILADEIENEQLNQQQELQPENNLQETQQEESLDITKSLGSVKGSYNNLNNYLKNTPNNKDGCCIYNNSI